MVENEIQEEYLTNLLDLMSEYSEEEVSELIQKGFLIEAVVILHRHIAEQIRHLLIEKLEKNNKKRITGELIGIIKKSDDDKLYELVYNLDIINASQKASLKSLNGFRNKLVHAFNKEKIERAYPSHEVKRIFEEAKWTSNLLDKKIYKQE